MPHLHSDLKRDVYGILAWSICLPALVLWPFLSAIPAFTLLGGGLTMPSISINVMMLLTGFWPIAAAYASYLFVRINKETKERRTSGQRGLLFGVYALAWTGLYLIVALAPS